MFTYSQNELELISEIEKCNSEFLLSREKEKLLARKRQYNYKRFHSAAEFRLALHKYRKQYGVQSYPTKVKELGWSKKKKAEALYLRKDKKVVVYACIAGRYDSLNEPRFRLNPNVSYVLFTDQDITSDVWEVREIPEQIRHLDGVRINRYIKMHPHEFLGEFDYSIYVDGNVQIISDMSGLVNFIDSEIGFAMHFHNIRNCVYQEAVACQCLKKGNSDGITADVERYLGMKYPRENGLLECTVFATDLHSETSKMLFEQWWEEFEQSASKRDQLSLPIVLWKNHIDLNRVGTLGSNLYRNPKFRVMSHI